MTRAQAYAEKYVEDCHFDPGYVAGFLAGVKWQKAAALKTAERRKTVRAKRSVQQRKRATCPACRKRFTYVNVYCPTCCGAGNY